jgi:hypothetical protein
MEMTVHQRAVDPADRNEFRNLSLNRALVKTGPTPDLNESGLDRPQVVFTGRL